jgi:hypothetical protein
VGALVDLGPNDTYFSLVPDTSGALTPVVTPYGARGLTQTLDVIAGIGGGNALGSWLRRDINGVLTDQSDIRLRKYESVVTCRDTMTPALDASWIGAAVTVSCAVELSYPVGGSAQRPAVSGSTRTEAGFVFYRPLLQMMVAEIKNSFQEYSAAYAWQLRLVEI